MSTFSGAAGADPSGAANSAWGQHTSWRGSCGLRMRWRPIEIVAVVAGFAIYWPIGLAIVGLKIAQRRGYTLESAMADVRSKFSGGFGAQAGNGPSQWRPFSASSGNAAFDEWRAAEMARLEEERRKLDAAHRDFAAHLDNLRRARDREEFDRFMRDRGNAGSAN